MIKPNEVAAKKKELIPKEVFQVFDELIVINYENGRSSFSQSLVIQKIREKFNNQLKFDYNWLKVKEIYEENGWSVKMDSPSWDEGYSTTYIFTKKKQE